MNPYLSYDDALMGGGKGSDVALKAAHARVEQDRAAQGWFEAPFDAKTARQVNALAKQVRARFRRLLVIGIGGSDLGARTLVEPLGDGSLQILFESNPDPETLHWHLFQKPDAWWKETAVNVVSKFGTTLETLSIFFAVRERLKRVLGEGFAEHIFATTEPGSGALYQLALKEGYTVIPHPFDIGGRFSVLSAVGLFPAACAGVPIARVLKGAAWLETARRKSPKNLASRFADLHVRAYEAGKNVHVVMPYADALASFALWYRQLWAESLGKRRADGTAVGPTPIAAHGATDQHSQLQLYQDGPADKVITFVEVEAFRFNTRLPKAIPIPGWDALKGRPFADLLHAERAGTASALAAADRPNGTIHLPKITPESIGALLQLYLTATAYAAALLNVNPYDQPGVESSKHTTRNLLAS